MFPNEKTEEGWIEMRKGGEEELGGAEGEETEIRIYSWGGASIPNKRKKIEKRNEIPSQKITSVNY